MARTVTLGGKRYRWQYRPRPRGTFGERCDGVCFEPSGTSPGLVVIDEALTGRRLLDTELHEALHAIYPGMSEPEVRRGARDLARLLSTLGYERIE